MKNLCDKEIKEKVDCLTKKQDFDQNKDQQNNIGGDQRINIEADKTFFAETQQQKVSFPRTNAR